MYRYLVQTPIPGSLVDFDNPMRQIKQQVDPQGWDSTGGPGAMEPLPSPVPVIVVSTNYWNHHEIEQQFSAQLRRVYSESSSWASSIGLPSPFLKAATFSVSDMKLEEFSRYISNTFGVAVEIDSGALTTARIPLDTPVTVSFSEIRLITALDLALGQTKCAWDVAENGSLMVTSPSAKKRTFRRDYQVGPLVLAPRARVADFDTLIEIVMSCVTPNSWKSVGGYATIQPKGNIAITVSHSVQGQIAVADLLANLLAAAGS